MPLIAALVLGGVIRMVGSGERGEQITGAVVVVAFAWAAALELSMPLFPPTADENAILYLLGAALLVGIPLDLWRNDPSPQARHGEAGVALLFGLGAAVWIRQVTDAWTAVFLVGWGVIVLRIHRVSASDAPTASSMLTVAAVGLGAVAWAAGFEVDRNLAFALAAAACGYFLLNWLNPSLRFGASLVFGGLGTLLILAIRLFAASQAIASALVLLGFVFFANAPVRRMLGRRAAGLSWAMPLITAVAAALPIALAILAAYIGVHFEAV